MAENNNSRELQHCNLHELSDTPLAAPPDIEKAEALLLLQPQVHMQVFHFFGPGIYIRELHIPKDTFVIGHYHVVPSTNVFLQGRLRLLQADGSWLELQAPLQFAGSVGRKTAHALSDCVWQNIFATDETDIEILENTLIRKSESFKDREKELKSCHLPQLA